ncbi:MAG TPA: DUF885 domain-containing protein [Chthonomonadaceae bacterium]|nr:DUF885 domain-containing protein [Chthonomonadaceae bacterium]
MSSRREPAVTAEPRDSADAQFESLTTEYLAMQYAAHPIMATAMGVHDYDDSVDNFNRFALRDDRDAIRAYLHAIDKLSLADLNADNRLDYRLARSSAQMALSALERQRWPERQPGLYADTLFHGLFLLVARNFASAETRALGLLGRLRAVPGALAEAQQNLKNPPRLFTEVAIESVEAGDTFFTELLPAFVAALPHSGLQKALHEATTAARAAFADYARFLRETLLPNATDDFALGKELFDYHLRIGHLMDKDRENSDALLEIGQEALEETKRELAALAEKIAPGREWAEIVAELKRDHPPAEELVRAYAEEMARAREFVRDCRLVTLPENETLRVMETPGFARSLLPYAAYLPPAPFEARQEGLFWVTPVPADAAPAQQETLLQGHSRYTIPIIALHEAFPGHHLQMARASQTPSRFRRHFANSNLFIEGWALYCEEMMWEQGFYTDPRVRLMQLNARLWRACRVLLDVRLHTRRMPPAEAVRFLMEEARLEEAHARAEVRRYALTPTQPMTYILGRRAILSLRSEARRRRGARFDLRQFHDQLLSYGSVPPSLLRDVLFFTP